MYTDYWNLIKPPFDNVPDSSMYVDCHESMENVISETIFAIKEGNECFAVIFGDVGLGKTLSLRVIIDSLEPEKYKVALITNPALSFIQLLREIIGQITGKQCEEKKKVDLLEIFNRLLFETNDQGQKIVIVIDESNVLTFANLDDLRLLTNMQDDERNLFTLILAGQIELAEKLEHPKMANLFQRIGTYGHIEKLPSEEALKTYVETRLKLAGSQRKIFTDDAIPIIWEFSEYGTPRLANKICKLCLKAGETNEFQMISGEVVAQIADRFKKISKPSLQKSKTQSRPEVETSQKGVEEPKTEKFPKTPRASVPRKEAPKVEIPPTDIPAQREVRPIEPKVVIPEQPLEKPSAPRVAEPRPVEPEVLIPAPPEKAAAPQLEETEPIEPEVVITEQPLEKPAAPQLEETEPVEPEVLIPAPPEKAAASPIEETEPVEPEVVIPEQPPEKSAAPTVEEPRPVEPEVVIPAPPEKAAAPPVEDVRPVQPSVVPQKPMVRPVPPPMEDVRPIQPRVVVPQQPTVRPVRPPMEDIRPVQPRVAVPEQPPARPLPPQWEETVRVETKVVPLAKSIPSYVPIAGVPLAKPSAINIPSGSETASPVQPKVVIPKQPSARPATTQREESGPVVEKQKETEDQPAQAEKEIFEEVLIGQQNVELAIPAHVIKQAQLANPESKNKLAGYWSAQIIKGNPHIMKSSLSDPVAIWFEVKNVILKKFNSA